MMTEEQPDETSPTDALRAAARALTTLRSRPCLFLSGEISRAQLLEVANALGERKGEALDLVLCSHGGDGVAAYLIARTLRRRFERLAIYVPLCAKSAATILCLSADELVLGEFGELGPIDRQFGDGTALLPFRALGQIVESAVSVAREEIPENPSSPTLSVVTPPKVTDFTTALLVAVFEPLSPLDFARAARGLEEASELALRLVRRYQPEIARDDPGALIARLVHGYPSHDFPIDFEELVDIGVSARLATEAESPIVEKIAGILASTDEKTTFVEIFDPANSDRSSVSTVTR